MKIKILVIATLSLLSACQTNVKDGSTSQSLAGEKFSVTPVADLYLEVSLQGNEVLGSSESEVSESANLTFSISEMSSGGVMMSIRSRLEKPVKYDLHMVDYQGNYHYTSSCPVMPGSGVFESWSHKIPEIVVSNIRVLEEDGSMACE